MRTHVLAHSRIRPIHLGPYNGAHTLIGKRSYGHKNKFLFVHKYSITQVQGLSLTDSQDARIDAYTSRVPAQASVSERDASVSAIPQNQHASVPAIPQNQHASVSAIPQYQHASVSAIPQYQHASVSACFSTRHPSVSARFVHKYSISISFSIRHQATSASVGERTSASVSAIPLSAHLGRPQHTSGHRPRGRPSHPTARRVRGTANRPSATGRLRQAICDRPSATGHQPSATDRLRTLRRPPPP